MKKIFPVILLFLIILTGCAMQSDIVDLENEVRRIKGIVIETQQDVARLQRSRKGQESGDLKVTQENLAELEASTEERFKILSKNQADFEARFDQLSTDIRVIQGRLEENNYRISELSGRIDDQEMSVQELMRKMDVVESKIRGPQSIVIPGKKIEPEKEEKPSAQEIARLPSKPAPAKPPKPPKPLPKAVSEGTTPPSEGTYIKPAEDTGLAPARGTAPQEETTPMEKPVPFAEGTFPRSPRVSISPSELYKWAYKDYLEGNYDLAISGFYNYLRVTPNGTLASNAYYWIGECYYSKGDYERAISAFETVTVDYPRSDKVAGALLKIGYSHEKMGDKDMAATYYKKVIEQFPFSREASLAKVRLAEIR